MIAPFGVGSTVVIPDGTSIIACGLDHWYKREDGELDDRPIDVEEFTVREWRLERVLGVSHLRLPPDYRRAQTGRQLPNTYLTVPFLRFPRWHHCPRCDRLTEMPLARRQGVVCRHCEDDGYKMQMSQVRFVAVCDQGHLQDFPWREWVHRTPNPSCRGTLKLISSGSISIAGHRVKCTGCGVSDRSMSGSVYSEAGGETTNLTENLEKGSRFTCRGLRPWLGDEEGEDCARPLHVVLRAASNVYFSHVRSAIYLPRNETPQELSRIMESTPVSTYMDLVREELGKEITPARLRRKFQEQFAPFDDAQIEAALASVEGDPVEPGEEEESEEEFRREELVELLRVRTDADLVITEHRMDDYDGSVMTPFDRVMLVKRLRETRAFRGFTRVFPESEQTASELRDELWKNPPSPARRWLPAYVVYGEGILLHVSENLVREWEQRPQVRERVTGLSQRFEEVRENRRLQDRSITSRLVLLHTLAHAVINRLIFECGYSSASLRERLYVSDSVDEPMAAVLIYTAAGDSDGTLGGLVRMGRPGFLEPVVAKAVEQAKWCSADPVCMEVGAKGGQGPDSCNLAACHNCSLLPETACELFNRFLDRGLMVGTAEEPMLGFFPWVEAQA